MTTEEPTPTHYMTLPVTFTRYEMGHSPGGGKIVGFQLSGDTKVVVERVKNNLYYAIHPSTEPAYVLAMQMPDAGDMGRMINEVRPRPMSPLAAMGHITRKLMELNCEFTFDAPGIITAHGPCLTVQLCEDTGAVLTAMCDGGIRRGTNPTEYKEVMEWAIAQLDEYYAQEG